MNLQAAPTGTVETLRQTRLVFAAVIRAHERVAALLAVYGDHDGAGAERRAAQEERARLARLTRDWWRGQAGQVAALLVGGLVLLAAGWLAGRGVISPGSRAC